jgi:hypothetical protein
VADLVAASAAPLRALLANIGRLQGVTADTPEGLLDSLEKRWSWDAAGLRSIALASAQSLTGPAQADVFPRYLLAVEGLARLVDEWTL